MLIHRVFNFLMPFPNALKAHFNAGVGHALLGFLNAVFTEMENTGRQYRIGFALDYTINKAHEESSKAKSCLNSLQDSIYKDALVALANLAVDRNH